MAGYMHIRADLDGGEAMSQERFCLTEIPLPADADEDVCKYQMPGTGRLILETVHGVIYIDVRFNDINCFAFIDGGREDHLLVPPNKVAGAPVMRWVYPKEI